VGVRVVTGRPVEGVRVGPEPLVLRLKMYPPIKERSAPRSRNPRSTIASHAATSEMIRAVTITTFPLNPGYRPGNRKRSSCFYR
jgi:hypothetical protein